MLGTELRDFGVFSFILKIRLRTRHYRSHFTPNGITGNQTHQASADVGQTFRKQARDAVLGSWKGRGEDQGTIHWTHGLESEFVCVCLRLC